MSVCGWIDKENVIYIYILFSHKNEENPTTCDNMNGPWGHYAKWNKSDRERQVLYDLTYMSNQNFFLKTELKDTDW